MAATVSTNTNTHHGSIGRQAGTNVASKSEEHTLVVVGSGGVGKSCLTVRFLKDEFTSDYDPTIEENYRKTVSVDSLSAVLNIVDTAGQQEYTALRDHHLTSGEGFLLVFSLMDSATLNEVVGLRESIVNLKDTSKVPLVLVGNKCDVPVEEREVKQEQVDQVLAQFTPAIPYFETSAKENIRVNEAFQALVRETRKYKSSKATASPATAATTATKTSSTQCACILL